MSWGSFRTPAEFQAPPTEKNDVIPLRSKTNPLLFGPADAAATEEPAPPSLSGHDHSLDFRNIIRTRACNTVKVTVCDRPNLAPPTKFEVGKFGLESLRWGEIMPEQKLFGPIRLSGRALYDDGQMVNSNVINHVIKVRLG
ncbi:unnamed protein product [Pleuronectes platessa]|uniref:Uncharacterized protein n=1 Tax=Pleuronectes platessa TaxID=8262 RepID=A0A9N7YT52_PLEPL|nr:unnamed protein product [Pleuronectes platessa]